MPPEQLSDYLDAMGLVPPTGCAWRHLSHDFTVCRSAANTHFLRWCRAGIWAGVLTAIRCEGRALVGSMTTTHSNSNTRPQRVARQALAALCGRPGPMEADQGG